MSKIDSPDAKDVAQDEHEETKMMEKVDVRERESVEAADEVEKTQETDMKEIDLDDQTGLHGAEKRLAVDEVATADQSTQEAPSPDNTKEETASAAPCQEHLTVESDPCTLEDSGDAGERSGVDSDDKDTSTAAGLDERPQLTTESTEEPSKNGEGAMDDSGFAQEEAEVLESPIQEKDEFRYGQEIAQPQFASRSPASSFHSVRPALGYKADTLDTRHSAEQNRRDSLELSPVELDDVPLEGDSTKRTDPAPADRIAPTGGGSGLFGSGRGFGFLSPSRDSSASSVPTAANASTSLTRSSSSSSSSFSLANATPTKCQTPAPAKTSSSSWKSGWSALLGAGSQAAASSSSNPEVPAAGSSSQAIAASSLPRDAQSPRDVALAGNFRLLGGSYNSFGRSKGSSGSFTRTRATSIIGGKSENAARRDANGVEEDQGDRLREAEEYEEGETDEEEDLDEGMEVLTTPRKVGKRRRRRTLGEDVEDSEGDGVVGGVDWSFWGAVMSDYEDVARKRPRDLSKAIQQGIPAVIRGTMWQLMSSSKSTELETKYSALLKLHSPHEKSIQKDLARTFPSHAYFQQAGGVGQENLFNVVKAYSIFDPEVGYTQGLAFIVAPLLLLMPEEEAFCVLVRLMESYDLRSHFLPEMPGLQLRLYQFDRLVEELLPVLHLHFVRSGVKSSMFASQWFMTMFSYRFPLSLVFRIYDIVFAEGIEAIFRFSLALLQINEEYLLKLDFEGCLKFLQGGLFDAYKQEYQVGEDAVEEDHLGQGGWKANEFVRDAYAMKISPFMLDSYAGEHIEQCRAQNAHAIEMDMLRNANRNLSSQVKSLEAALATMNSEHVELVRQLVNSRIEKEEIESELVRYKVLYAELSHAQQEAMSSQPLPPRQDSRSSSSSTTRKLGLWA